MIQTQRTTPHTEILFQCRSRVRVAGFGPVLVLSSEQRIPDALDRVGGCVGVLVVVRCARIVFGVIFVGVTIRARGLFQRRIVGGENAAGGDDDRRRGDVRSRWVVLDPADWGETGRMGMG